MTSNWFEQLKHRYQWKPIAGCPGRYILSEGVVHFSIEELVGQSVEVKKADFKNAADTVYYCHFVGGGVISYAKPDGFLHTLCDTGAMKRKLDMLQS